MTQNETDPNVISLLSEVIMVDQLTRARLSRALPKGMELSHFSVLNHLAHVQSEKGPAELARAFSVTRGAMTNTLNKLEAAGYVHIRPDWEDARRKFVSISDAGRGARDQALMAIAPLTQELAHELGTDALKAALPVMRALRRQLLAT